MCKPASMIVTRGHHKVCWSEKTDSHHEIISEFGIKETDARGDINIVPIEITPPNGKLNTPISKWKYKADYQGYGRELPDWYDAEKAEKEVRCALKYWKKQKVITRDRKEVKDGQFYVYGCSIFKASNCQIVCYNSTVKAWGNSTVEAFGSNTVEAFHSIDPSCLKSKTAVLIDRSKCNEVVVHTKKG